MRKHSWRSSLPNSPRRFPLKPGRLACWRNGPVLVTSLGWVSQFLLLPALLNGYAAGIHWWLCAKCPGIPFNKNSCLLKKLQVNFVLAQESCDFLLAYIVRISEHANSLFGRRISNRCRRLARICWHTCLLVEKSGHVQGPAARTWASARPEPFQTAYESTSMPHAPLQNDNLDARRPEKFQMSA